MLTILHHIKTVTINNKQEIRSSFRGWGGRKADKKKASKNLI